jgi:hypothetical protein
MTTRIVDPAVPFLNPPAALPAAPQFPGFTNGDLTTSLSFRQSTGRGAFSVRATGLLTSAYVY